MIVDHSKPLFNLKEHWERAGNLTGTDHDYAAHI